MRITPPLPLTLSATNVAATTLAAWNVATAYTVGNQVYYNPTSALVFHAFEALTAHTGSAPVVGSTADWLDLGPVNQRAMFDDRTSTLTTNTTSIDVTVLPGAFFDTVALARLEGVLTVRVKIVRSGATLYDQTFDVSDDATAWGDYFFGDRAGVRTALNINPEIFYSNASVQVVCTGTSGQPVGIGLLLIGRSRLLGDTLMAPSVGIEDYSTKETDVFGNTYLLERQYADVANVELILDAGQVDAVRRELARYRATPVLYNLNNDAGDAYDSLVIFGKYDAFDVKIAYHTRAFCSLAVQSIL